MLHLSLFHLYLACKGLTTYQYIQLKRIQPLTSSTQTKKKVVKPSGRSTQSSQIEIEADGHAMELNHKNHQESPSENRYNEQLHSEAVIMERSSSPSMHSFRSANGNMAQISATPHSHTKETSVGNIARSPSLTNADHDGQPHQPSNTPHHCIGPQIFGMNKLSTIQEEDSSFHQTVHNDAYSYLMKDKSPQSAHPSNSDNRPGAPVRGFKHHVHEVSQDEKELRKNPGEKRGLTKQQYIALHSSTIGGGTSFGGYSRSHR